VESVPIRKDRLMAPKKANRSATLSVY